MKIILALMLLSSATMARMNQPQPCPPSFTDTGTHCLKPPVYGRGWGSRSIARCESDHGAGNCEKCLSLYYPKCQESFVAQGCNLCSPVCPPNTTDVGAMCQK